MILSAPASTFLFRLSKSNSLFFESGCISGYPATEISKFANFFKPAVISAAFLYPSG